MGVNGKQKGNSFERKIANMFSGRFAEYTGIEQSFRRNPDSGSFFGGKNVARAETHDTEWAVYGDLICPKAFNFQIECKHYKAPPKLNGILKQSWKEWDTWIEQAHRNSDASGKDSLIIIRYNNTETLVMTDRGVSPLEPIINYNGMEIQTLENILTLPDSFFFS